MYGLRRQSFYYHFKDVYDLFAWTVRQERVLLTNRLADCITWRQAFLDLLDRAGEERAFYRAVLEQGGSIFMSRHKLLLTAGAPFPGAFE